MEACPEGWRLPSKEEFEELKTVAGQKVGDKDKAGTVLKSRNGWIDNEGKSGNGTDVLEFTALPAGYYGGDFFDREGKVALFWSSSEHESDFAYGLALSDGEDAHMYYHLKNRGFSVRCVKNSNEGLASGKSLTRASEAVAASPQPGKIMKDSRDGKTYKTVQIGDKVWMAENLNFDYNHGTAKSVCYENKPENCDKYGRLYTWAAAMDSAAIYSRDGARCGDGKECEAIGTVRGVCPEGWHLPSKEDFEELAKAAGGRQDGVYKRKWNYAGKPLKSKTGWAENDGKSGNGTDALGFAALPAGDYFSNYGSFYYEGKNAYFWSSTEYGKRRAYDLDLGYDGVDARVYYDDKSRGFSVRCIKNSN